MDLEGIFGHYPLVVEVGGANAHPSGLHFVCHDPLVLSMGFMGGFNTEVCFRRADAFRVLVVVRSQQS